jgi:cytochrome c553
MPTPKIPLFCLCVLWLAIPLPTWAQTSLTPVQESFFEKNIRPAFVKYCYECHSLESGKTRGGLLVDTRDGLHQGGDTGSAVVPGKLEDSVLWGAINWADYEMPPKGKMPSNVIDKFKQWIEMGAPDPRVREKLFVESKVDIAAGKKHWAFQKPIQPAKSGIDAFVSAKLLEADTKPVASADAWTLLRRLNFDLIGLPPTLDETRAFNVFWEKDSQAAIEAKVDELLKRPQFGERWGRHWLDVARYAESSGKDVNFTFPHAWRYRDYVFDAFNADKPYDDFIREQIAGDLLPIKTDEKWQENLIATGFLAMGTKGLNERSPRQFRMDVIDEQIDTMSQAILGITVACARCHDHKLDPIPTTDYYALAGIFLSTKTFYGTVSGLQNRRPSTLLLLPLIDKHRLSRSYSQAEIEGMRERVSELQTSIRTQRSEARRNGEQVEQRKMLALRNQIARVEGILSTLTTEGVPQSVGMGLQDSRPVNANVLARGDVEKPAQEVPRGFLQVLDDVGKAEIKAGKSGRRELADWLVSKENPLTARVMVNRLWMHLFGEALVGTPNNWGFSGQRPTHPQLLDYLAIRFMENDWSVKSMIREIVLSQTYQRSSQFNQDNYAADPDNKWLWRANPRQVDAEALRDSILSLGGNLDLERPHGSEIAAAGNKRVGRLIDQSSFSPVNHHRSVYLPILRNNLPEALELFDFADPSVTSAKREATNVPAQALYLMNNRFVTRQAQAMAMRLWDRFDNTNERVRWAVHQAYGRPAREDEIEATVQFFQQFKPEVKPISTDQVNQPSRRRTMSNSGRRPSRGRRPVESVTLLTLTPEQQTLAMFCQALMASAEFRILN